MTINFDLTAEDKATASDADLYQRFGGGSKYVAWVVGILALLGMGYRFYREVEPQQRPFWIGVFLVIYVVVFTARRKRRHVRTGSVVMEFSPEGVRREARGESLTLPWGALGKFRETRDVFLLYRRGSKEYEFIPKRAVRDPEREAELRNILQTFIGGAAFSAVGPVGGAAWPLQSPPPLPSALPARGAATGPGVSIRFRYRFRDYFGRALASWITRGIMLFGLAIVVITVLRDGSLRIQNVTGINFLLSLVPLLVFESFIPTVFALILWLGDARRRDDHEVTLSDSGVTRVGPMGSETTAWEELPCFKETFGTFLLWRPHSPVFYLLPKSALGTADHVSALRDLLRARSRPSTWYFF